MVKIFGKKKDKVTAIQKKCFAQNIADRLITTLGYVLIPIFTLYLPRLFGLFVSLACPAEVALIATHAHCISIFL